MPTLRFEGNSDDTFGEYAHTRDDYDNCASGKPIEYLVMDPETGDALVVTGQYCPGKSGSWVVGVSTWVDAGTPENEYDPPFPRWPMRIEPQHYRNGFNPSLVIDAPSGVEVVCLTRGRG